MNLFDTPQEKGSGEWKSVGTILREKRADLYPMGMGKKKMVRLSVKPGPGHRQQYFILKNAR